MSAVYKAIGAVSEAMSASGISKSRNNASQGYKFRGIDDVLNALSGALVSAGLVILPRCISRDVVERTTGNGKALFYVTCQVEFDLVSTEDGSKHTVCTFGEAMDSADKATNKAMSAAYKYLALLVFCIPTEASSDTDADFSTHEVKPASGPASKSVTKPATSVYPADQVKAGIARGDASGAATYLAGLMPVDLDKIWPKLTESEQAALTAAWPE